MHIFREGYGIKFLTPYGTTESTTSFAYVLPRPDQKWSDITEHPDPAMPDGNDYGPGRLHVMNSLSARYAPRAWWPWFARYDLSDIIGRSDEKTTVARLRLRRITAKTFAHIIRLGWCAGAILRGLILPSAILPGANLTGTDLTGTDLMDANLTGANLTGANLMDANLMDADLEGADLTGANLTGAGLWFANLTGANLTGANLTDANLTGALRSN